MAKSNCPAEDSAPPQASAGQLTPRFLPLSLSNILLQVTVAISPSDAKGASKGPVFCAHPIRRPQQANAGFQKVGKRGGASATKREFNLSKPEDTVDFRERIRRSIWRSELRLSCDKLLVVRVVLSFGGKVSLLLYISAGWGWIAFCRKSSPLSSFLNAAFVEGSSGLKKTENSGAPFSNTFQRGDMDG